ncbi:hypothetical protein FKP32DRAFT_1596294 [Trametes sanguinea]|nr:hypothetical protein FKP32DRAFT_1596294 [Trametes sanguinea]
MALVVPHPVPDLSSELPVHNTTSSSPSPRRSSRISHSHSSPSAPAATRIATPPTSPLVPRPSSSASSRSRSRHTSNKLRIRPRTRAASPTASSSSPSPSPSPPPLPSLKIRIRAGSKRKRPPAPVPSTSASSSDESDSDSRSYELVVAAAPSSTPADVLYQTPRQLRYAKRQRLNPPTPTAHERSHAPLQASQDAVLLPDHDQLPQHADHASLACSALQENDTSSNGSHFEVDADDGAVVNARSSEEYGQVELYEDEDEEDSDGPIFTPLPRTPPPCRVRQTDATEPAIWKSVCQERVEHLKRVYRDVYRAVVHAEAAAFEEMYGTSFVPAQAAASAAVASELCKETAGIQFEHYAPDGEGSDEDADGDIDMEDVSSSSDSDDSGSDADADTDDDESDSDSESVEEPAYEKVLVLDPSALDPSSSSASVALPTLPRLSTIRVHGIDSHPLPTRGGVPFIGRGTPPARARRAEWAAPVSKLPARSPSRSLSPSSTGSESTWEEHGYFTQDMVPVEPAPVASAGMDMQMDYGMDVFDDRDAANHEHSMPWLDPVLRAESLSPTTTPTPGPSTTPTSFPSVFPGGASAQASIVPPPFVFQPTSYDASLFGAAHGNGGELPSPTGCALHASFLECLQAPGCAGPALTASLYNASPALAHAPFVFSPSPSASPSPPLSPSSTPFAPAAAAAGAYPFPNQELAQFVRAQLVVSSGPASGSVTLGNALG